MQRRAFVFPDRVASAFAALALLLAFLAPGRAFADAKEAEALRARAKVAIDRKDYNEATSLLDKAYKADPSNHGILKDLAVTFASAGKIDESVARYRQYIAQVPSDEGAKLAMATTLSWSKDRAQLKQSEDLLTEYMAQHPEADDALLQRARVRSWTGQSEAAEKDYRAYLAKHADEPKVKLELAMALSGRKDPAALAGAIAIYDAHLAANPNDLDIVLQRGRVRSWAGNITESAADYRAYLKAKPDDAAVRLELARALSWSNKPEDIRDSIVLYRAHLAGKPDDEAAKLEFARVLLKSKRPEELQEGKTLFDQYVAAHPGEEAFLERARARAAAGLTELAIADFRTYLSKHPGDPKASIDLAQALSGSKDKGALREAIFIYDAHLAKYPQDAAALLGRGRVKGWAGMTAEAAKDLKAYAQLKQGDATVDLEIANVLAQGADPSESIPYYDRYVPRHPEDLDSRLRFARALLWSGNYSRAENELDALRRAAQTDDRKGEIDLELVRLYAQTNRRYEAIDLVEEVLARDPRNQAALVERGRLQVFLGSRIEPRLFYYEDKSGIVVSSLTIDARAALSRNLAIIGDISGYTLGTVAETVLTSRVNLGAWGRYKALELEAAGGPRLYQYFDPRLGVRAAVRARPASWSSLAFNYHFDDIYFDMLQPASLSAQIRGHALFLTGEATLPLRIRLTGRMGTRILRPDNQSLDATGTIGVPIYGPVSIGYNAQFISWRFNDPSYWSPQAFVAHLGIVRLAQSFGTSGFGYDVQGVAGIAGERIARTPEAGFGRSFGLSAALSYALNERVLLRLSGQYSQTVRELPRPVLGGAQAVAVPVDTDDEPSIYWWVATTASATFFL
jgi:thioredoxin-like negative regulator of GroEL